MRRTSAAIKAGLLLLVISTTSFAQWTNQQSGTTERLRGVSAVSSTVAWASGTHGTFVRTTDGGTTWIVGRVPGADSLDFRDVEAFGPEVAYLLSIGPGGTSRIYKTVNAGKDWVQQYKGDDSRIFLDEFAFWDSEHGIVVGDEIQGHLLVLRTNDGGKHWDRIAARQLPPAIPGEGAFAASGSGITVQGKNNVWIGTGVKTARVYRSTDRGVSWNVSMTPVLHDSESSGIFSVAFADAKHGVVVGGDYRKEQDARDNIALTNDGGISWQLVSQSPPKGFRSAVVYGTKKFLIAVGPSGSDLSVDGGLTWKSLGSPGFHALSISKDKKVVWAVGERGRIASLAPSTTH